MSESKFMLEPSFTIRNEEGGTHIEVCLDPDTGTWPCIVTHSNDGQPPVAAVHMHPTEARLVANAINKLCDFIDS